MAVRQVMRAALIISATAVGGVAAYEAYAVWRADQRTEATLSRFLSGRPELEPSDLSSEQGNILVTVEDPSFYLHHGVDFSAPGQGLTTIAQAITKFLYFDRFKPGFAKLEQSLIARFVVSRRLTRDQQLTIFLNHSYFGEGEGEPIRGVPRRGAGPV